MMKQIKKLADRLGNVLINFAGLREDTQPKEFKPVIYSIREKGFVKNDSKVFYITYMDNPDQHHFKALILAQSRSADFRQNSTLGGVLFLASDMIQRVEMLKVNIGEELDLKGKTLSDYLINGED